MLRRFGAALLLFAAAAAPVRAQVPPRIPAEAFAVEPLINAPRLSPDGKRVLGTMTFKDRTVPAVLDLKAGQVQPLNLPEKSDYKWARWAGDDRVLISLQLQLNYTGFPIAATRLIGVQLSTRKVTYLGLKTQGPRGDDILYADPDGTYALLAQQPSIYAYPSVYRFDLDTGKATKIVPERDGVFDWYADTAGVVRAGFGVRDQIVTLFYRHDEGQPFKKVERIKLGQDKEADQLLGQLRLSPGTDDGYVLTGKRDGRIALYRYNYATRTLGDQVFAAPANDVTGFDLSDDNKGVEAVYFTDDRDRVVWFDDRLKAHQSDVDKATAGKQASIISRSRDGGRMIVYLGSSRDPGSYYLYDVDSGLMRRIVQFAPQVPRSALAETQSVSYEARDGLKVPAYLTLPQGRSARNLPLIVMPHGGPYGIRDTLSYDSHVQFLANRGYAVLQPNFRGSGGYGYAYYEKGEGQFGRAMQDDLDDATDWLVKQGTVDAKRVCIVGLSYGGYAALWGATRNPERYRCAASFAGISDVRRILNYSSDFFYNRKYRSDWRRIIKGEEQFDLASISPLQQVDRLRVPVLIAQGSDDKVVPSIQATTYVEALKKAGKTYEYRLYDKEKHGPTTPANLTDWLKRLDAFLAKHNPA